MKFLLGKTKISIHRDNGASEQYELYGDRSRSKKAGNNFFLNF